MTQEVARHFLQRPSVLALIFANLVPVLGVLFFDWSLKSVFYLYLFENLIVGCFGLLHIFQAEWLHAPDGVVKEYHQSLVRTKRLTYAFTFVCLYGLFIMFHGVLLSIPFPLYTIDLQEMLPGILALVISHGISYTINFLGHEEYRKMSAQVIFIRPFKRAMGLQLCLAFLALSPFLLALLGSVVYLTLFIIAKTLIDLRFHYWEHATSWD